MCIHITRILELELLMIFQSNNVQRFFVFAFGFFQFFVGVVVFLFFGGGGELSRWFSKTIVLFDFLTSSQQI